ncbi:LATERAL ORGAN BOUNDARIES DOMAIN GENE 36, ASYMMETRIC LEAVES 2-like 1 [Hibiscus trionum]|uniref:LATERAL ORGAN BOUNDARIES DOMAIN GENE 36, ASYMMETRIC LEAVES 2-like 1 n=1 Tax=Hibiscus trionum TaxID=183268 RepID=A0A9W7IF07_HIBTR|nr:LATERAL ORGAN BOUNDARIES DOMAIN GENE 36, ASYMMETRIC LEAVES 2-like 1 [Hibiscus trionum]
MSSFNSPCAACKFLRRKCTQECVFAPYFPPDNPRKFANVHKVFGASNVAKLLNELNTSQREDAVNSLAYEAEARLRDPVYGCVGLISILQQKLKQMQDDLNNAKKELATYIGPQAMLPILQPPVFFHHVGNTAAGAVVSGQLVMGETQQQQVFKAQQQLAAVPVIAAREQQEMLYEQHHGGQQPEIVRFNNGFERSGSVTATGFIQITSAVATMSPPSLALGSFENPYQIQSQQDHHHHPLEAQLLLQSRQVQPPQQPPQQPQRSGSEEEARSIGPVE